MNAPTNAELRLLIFGVRRLLTKLRGDVRNLERREHVEPEWIARAQLEVRDATRLHSKLMAEATRRGMVIVTRWKEQP